mmetsp:Transcript_2233/g.5188  ORF Transcript_2233/g.5188 Transcript_2233/m.5188 type:complete len:212 (-) Transcript_2233:547-1182(-)
MPSISSTAEGFSIFASNLISLKPKLRTRCRSSFISSLVWTKDMAIQSTPALQANSMSFLSFSVIGDMAKMTSGVFTPLLAFNRPATVTLQSTKGVASFDSFASSTGTSLPSSKRPHPTISMRMFPSSNSNCLPGFNASKISGCGNCTRLTSPKSGSMSKRNICPLSSSTPLGSANFPHLCLGPCMSAKIPMGWRYLVSTLRMRLIRSVFSS